MRVERRFCIPLIFFSFLLEDNIVSCGPGMSSTLGWQHSALPAFLGSPVLALLLLGACLKSFGNLSWRDMGCVMQFSALILKLQIRKKMKYQGPSHSRHSGDFLKLNCTDGAGMLTEWTQTKHKAPRQWEKEMKLNMGGATAEAQ